MDSTIIVQERPNKGRALIAARNLHAGETVLSEPPILLTPSIRCIHNICSCCLRYIDGRYLHVVWQHTHNPPISRHPPTLGTTAVTCSTCNTAKFCSAACHAASTAPHIHSPWLCRYCQCCWVFCWDGYMCICVYMVFATMLLAADWSSPTCIQANGTPILETPLPYCCPPSPTVTPNPLLVPSIPYCPPPTVTSNPLLVPPIPTCTPNS